MDGERNSLLKQIGAIDTNDLPYTAHTYIARTGHIAWHLHEHVCTLVCACLVSEQAQFETLGLELESTACTSRMSHVTVRWKAILEIAIPSILLNGGMHASEEGCLKLTLLFKPYALF